jgi:hypothetical protein
MREMLCSASLEILYFQSRSEYMGAIFPFDSGGERSYPEKLHATLWVVPSRITPTRVLGLIRHLERRRGVPERIADSCRILYCGGLTSQCASYPVVQFEVAPAHFLNIGTGTRLQNGRLSTSIRSSNHR